MEVPLRAYPCYEFMTLFSILFEKIIQIRRRLANIFSMHGKWLFPTLKSLFHISPSPCAISCSTILLFVFIYLSRVKIQWIYV